MGSFIRTFQSQFGKYEPFAAGLVLLLGALAGVWYWKKWQEEGEDDPRGERQSLLQGIEEAYAAGELDRAAYEAAIAKLGGRKPDAAKKAKRDVRSRPASRPDGETAMPGGEAQAGGSQGDPGEAGRTADQ